MDAQSTSYRPPQDSIDFGRPAPAEATSSHSAPLAPTAAPQRLQPGLHPAHLGRRERCCFVLLQHHITRV